MLKSQVSIAPVAIYSIWDGEVGATVTQHCGLHGFYSAAVVAIHMDGPIETFQYDGYQTWFGAGQLGREAGETAMLCWIAETLGLLASGDGLAAGTYSEVVLKQEFGLPEEV